ncbi:MAG: ATP-binding protein [Candidatus Cloacimonetes bacterium]|nr:ATP-binding protein [Candidatus Cloacimonadota bacterium]
MDPRINVVENRLGKIGRIIAVAGGKGGIGKSTIASLLALILAEANQKVGLLDLDFTGASTHTILGIHDFSFPDEDQGIIPPKYHGISYITIANFTQDKGTPMRGHDITNAILELLAITRWDELDYLIIDMPPGINDTTLDIIRLIKNIEFCMVTTPSKITTKVVRNSINLLKELDIPILGLIENMTYPAMPYAKQCFEGCYLGTIPYDENYEAAIGDAETLLETKIAKTLQNFTMICDKMC